MMKNYNKKFLVITALLFLICTSFTKDVSYSQESDETFDEFEDFDKELDSSESEVSESGPTSLSDEEVDDEGFFDESVSSEDSTNEAVDESNSEPLTDQAPTEEALNTTIEEPTPNNLEKEANQDISADDDFFESEDSTAETLEAESSPVVNSPPAISKSQTLQFDDDPDLNYETKLHDIYMKFLAEPIPDNEWDEIVGAKTSEAYTIQKGDTLWDLSKTFFGDGNYWPKIWSVNSKITNPHLIEPKNVIRFILGNENEAPQFAITENSTEGSESVAEEDNLESTVEESNLEDLTQGAAQLEEELASDFNEASLEEELLSDEELEGVVIPPPEVIVRPVTQVFPPSLPQWRSHADAILKSREVDLKKVEKPPRLVSLPLSYYIDENQPAGIAKVVDIEGGGKGAAQFQYIYIRTKKGYLKVGEKLMAVKNMGPLLTKDRVQEDAIIWEVQGQIIVDQKVEATKKYRSDLYEVHRAYVESALTSVSIGSDLLRGGYIFVDDSKKGRVPNVSGLIIGGAYGNKRDLLSKDSLAYLNIGTNEGVKVGDVLPVYSNNYVERRDPYVLTTHRPMGLIKIAKVSELYSTGYIVENDGSINIGDFVGSKKGFEKEFLKNRISTKSSDPDEDTADNELMEIQSLLNSIEEDLDPAKTEKFEYME